MKKIIALTLVFIFVLCACNTEKGGNESSEGQKDISQNSSEASSEDSSSYEIYDSSVNDESIPADDEEIQFPYLIIGGIEVTADNCNDVLGDGTVRVEWSDDFDICFITLNNAKIKCDVLPDSPEMESVNGIICETDMELVLVGENEIYCNYSAPDYIWYRGISYVGKNGSSLTVSGEGSLDINLGGEDNLSSVYGIDYDKVIVEKNATVKIKAVGGITVGVTADKENIIISDNGSLTTDINSAYEDISQ